MHFTQGVQHQRRGRNRVEKRSVRICPWNSPLEWNQKKSKGKKARNPIRHRSAHSSTHIIIEALISSYRTHAH
ncbi:hypothetical protein [Paenibacillus sp. 453mf]|uniref:hypothetical protein n=1 Tax=Paenibacillus sp. 453mf TaxID=1761874 RepID=UPI001113997F|nr:hypothetical protein [Paenibacillus sp. 453mf]